MSTTVLYEITTNPLYVTRQANINESTNISFPSTVSGFLIEIILIIKSEWLTGLPPALGLP